MARHLTGFADRAENPLAYSGYCVQVHGRMPSCTFPVCTFGFNGLRRACRPRASCVPFVRGFALALLRVLSCLREAFMRTLNGDEGEEPSADPLPPGRNEEGHDRHDSRCQAVESYSRSE